MKLISVLDHLAATPATPAATPRRALLGQLGRAAVAALPLGLGASSATAETNDSSYDAVLQLLQLERLQIALYTQGLATANLIPTAQQADFQRMLGHQTQHAALLLQSLQNAGALVPASPTFDFSGRRNVVVNPVLFPNVFTSFDEFLSLAQQIEDLGARLYLNHAFNVTFDAPLSRNILRMQPVEAAHAAHVRGLRRSRGAVVQNWPSEEDAAIVRPTAAQALTVAATTGENNSVQPVSASVNVPFANFLLISKNTAVRDPALAEAFDEPVSSAIAQAALNLFG